MKGKIPTYDEIGVEDAHERRSEFCWVDVRSDHEYHGPLGHVEDAILSSLPSLSVNASGLPGDLPLLMVCRSGKRSGVACELLAKLGIGSATNLKGGMIAWNLAELPIEETVPASLGALNRQLIMWLAQVSPLTFDSATELVSERCELIGVARDEPDRETVKDVIDCIEDYVVSLGAPPDLALSINWFRRMLGTL